MYEVEMDSVMSILRAYEQFTRVLLLTSEPNVTAFVKETFREAFRTHASREDADYILHMILKAR